MNYWTDMGFDENGIRPGLQPMFDHAARQSGVYGNPMLEDYAQRQHDTNRRVLESTALIVGGVAAWNMHRNGSFHSEGAYVPETSAPWSANSRHGVSTGMVLPSSHLGMKALRVTGKILKAVVIVVIALLVGMIAGGAE